MVERKFDVCVIGSGPGGAFAAHDLALKGVRVAVMEVGAEKSDTRLNSTISAPESSILGRQNIGFSRQIGGTSNLWSGGMMELDEIDFKFREEVGVEGWPFNKGEFTTYYRRVDQLIGVESNFERVGVPNTQIEGRVYNGLRTPFTTKKLVENVNNLTLFQQVNVVGLDIIEEQDQLLVQALQCVDIKTKTEFLVTASKFIFSAGTLGSVRLLLHSLKPFSDVASLGYKHIGKYISTHPKADIGELKLYRPLPASNPLIQVKNEDKAVRWYQFGLTTNMIEETGSFNHSLRLTSLFQRRFLVFLDKVIDLVSYLPVKCQEFISKMLTSAGVAFFNLVDRLRFFKSSGRTLAVRGFFDQAPSINNSISLSNCVDDFGMPLVKINYCFSENDWQNVEAFIEKVSAELHNSGIGRLNYERPCNEKFTAIHSHFIGGTRMGNCVERSVVDSSLRVHGVKNLYVSGPSVFPTFGHANPFYSIAALSLRLAEHLHQNLSSTKIINDGKSKNA